MNDQELIRNMIALGEANASVACARIARAVKEGTNSEGVLARALIDVLDDFNKEDQFARSSLCRDNLIEGFCDEVQRFIEADAGGDPDRDKRPRI